MMQQPKTQGCAHRVIDQRQLQNIGLNRRRARGQSRLCCPDAREIEIHRDRGVTLPHDQIGESPHPRGHIQNNLARWQALQELVDQGAFALVEPATLLGLFKPLPFVLSIGLELAPARLGINAARMHLVW